MMQLWYLVAVVYMTIVGADQRLKIKSRSNRLTQILQLWHEPSKRENCGIGFQWVSHIKWPLLEVSGIRITLW